MIYDLRKFPVNKHLRALMCVLLGALGAVQVNAATFPASTSGNRTTFAGGTYDTDAIAAGASMAVSAGAIWASQTKAIKTAAGVAANVVVKAAPAAGAIRSAVAACFGNPLCVVATAAAAAYVANELSFNYTVGADGLPVVTKADPNACPTTAGCVMYYVTPGWSTTQQGPGKTTPAAACAAYASIAGVPTTVIQTDIGPLCQWKPNGYAYTDGTYIRNYQVPAGPITTVPSTPAELADAIGSKTDWADNSKLPQLIKDAVIAGQPKLGSYQNPYIVPVSVPTSITGPATVAASPTTTTKADGSKVTKTTTTNLGYYPPAVEATETTVETATTPEGVTTTTSTTTAPATAAQETPDFCATNPNSNACRSDEFDTPTENLPKLDKAITFAAENLGFGAGACPANVTQNLKAAHQSITLINWTENCSKLTTYVKPLVLSMGAFMAFTILFIGGKLE